MTHIFGAVTATSAAAVAAAHTHTLPESTNPHAHTTSTQGPNNLLPDLRPKWKEEM
jgi:hypothetical protein